MNDENHNTAWIMLAQYRHASQTSMSTGDEGPSLLEQMMAAREAALPQKNTPAATEEAVKEKKTFGAGFKKGFLSGGSDDKPKKQNVSTI